MAVSDDLPKHRTLVSDPSKDNRVIRFTLLILIVASPALASAAPASKQYWDDGVRTGGMGVAYLRERVVTQISSASSSSRRLGGECSERISDSPAALLRPVQTRSALQKAARFPKGSPIL